jgi:hypothetical protein
MKNLFFGALCMLLIASCEDQYNIEFDKNLLEVENNYIFINPDYLYISNEILVNFV